MVGLLFLLALADQTLVCHVSFKYGGVGGVGGVYGAGVLGGREMNSKTLFFKKSLLL